ncbi:hypothetical protein L210DRAFT_3640833 [Boletus edulis BED1]|uniref:Fungal-type protein kinase domain-containing protein n=1 Tax=Boletus edulis BED1 TaxID=1328754 RepID=A0AAD4C6N7_BOLED|nr:hypothetical protein L210DRAFT_3640833 [Boletus edulis BED1]
MVDSDCNSILLGVTFTDGTALGFDSTITPTQNSQKTIRIVKQGKEYHILVDTLLFSSFSLHSRGTTVWTGKVTIDQEEHDVVIKDSWVDPLRRYTEGRILKMLEKAGVKGVPKLVHEQQVQTPHPIMGEFINHSTHILRTLFRGSSQASYYLCVLSRLVSKPRGYPIFDFNSLAELLVGLIDCLCGASEPLSPATANLGLAAHRDTLNRAHILHRDVSLFNLLLVLAMHSDVGEGFLDQVLKGPEKDVGDDTGATGIRISGKTEPLSRTNLEDTHNILIPVADEPIPSDTGPSIDTSPLHCTGTWAWMAAELSHVGSGMPVVHRAHHDLELFFYILLAICLLYDEPAKLKPAKVLSQSFDPFFTITKPSTLNVVTIQSDFGWTTHMLPYVSSYFQPLIPLLEKIRKELILPIKMHGGKLQANLDFTHDHFIEDIVMVLAKLPGSSWVPKIPNTRKGVVQGGSVSSTFSLPVTPSSTPSAGTVLPEIPLP